MKSVELYGLSRAPLEKTRKLDFDIVISRKPKNQDIRSEKPKIRYPESGDQEPWQHRRVFYECLRTPWALRDNPHTKHGAYPKSDVDKWNQWKSNLLFHWFHLFSIILICLHTTSRRVHHNSGLSQTIVETSMATPTARFSDPRFWNFDFRFSSVWRSGGTILVITMKTCSDNLPVLLEWTLGML